MTEPPQKGSSPGSGWVAAAVLGFALVGVLRPQSAAEAGPAPRRRRAGSPRAGSPRADGRPRGEPSSGSSRPRAGTNGAAPVVHRPGLLGIARSVMDRYGNDNIGLVAAGVAFYVMLSIFPALAALVSLYALVGNPDDVAARIQDYGDLLPPAALKLILDGLHKFAGTAGSTLSSALGVSVLLALWSARNGISSVMSGLNIAYEEAETRSFVVLTLMAMGLTLGAVVFAAAAIFAVAIIPIILAFLPFGSVLGTVMDVARWPVLAVLVAVGFALIYRWGPSRRRANWRWISWGSGIATVLWLVGSALFSIYVGRFGSYDATYGTLGAAVVLLLWLWVSALVLLIGAEIDSELDQRAELAGSPLASVPTGAPRP